MLGKTKDINLKIALQIVRQLIVRCLGMSQHTDVAMNAQMILDGRNWNSLDE